MPAKDRNSIKADIIRDIEDNQQGKVSPGDIRSILLDILDSHNVLSSGKDIVAGNISTTNFGNTYVGHGVNNSKDVDMVTSLGYFALRSNEGDQNTAVGAYSSTCNVYGSGNFSAGYGALSNNFDGDGNVAVGNHALKGVKHGDFNVGLGNSAGYYIDENDSYKFYVASHDISESGMCNNPDGLSGQPPLMYGDFLNSRLVIGSDTMSSHGALQVNGNIIPVDTGDIGHPTAIWDTLYIKELDSDGTIESLRDINPKQDETFNFGSSDKKWNALYTKNLYVDGIAEINNVKYTNVEDSYYYNKQIHLATSGVDSNNNTKPYLTDEGLDGAGIVVKSSGTDYLRNYFFTYKAPDLDWGCPQSENAYSRSSWLSNISLEIMDGRQLKTQRVMSSDELALVAQGCYGFYVGENVVLGTQTNRNDYTEDHYSPNYISYSSGDYSIFNVSETSGVSIEDNLLTRYDGSENLTGFKREYVDSSDSRFALSSYLNSQEPVGEFVSMRDEAKFGFSDSSGFIPQTLFNTYSSGDSVVRYTGTSSSIQLASDNMFESGVEIKHSDGELSISIKGGNTVSLDATLLMHETSGELTDREGWGNLFVKPTPAKSTPNSLFYRNEDGQEFDLLVSSSGDKTAPESVYTDALGNTFAGFESTEDRAASTNSGNLERNTTLGYRSLRNLLSGDDNLAIGAMAGSGMRFGNRNIFIGSRAGLLDNDLGQTINNQFRLGHNNDDLLMSGQLPYGNNRGYVYVQSDIGIVSKDNGDKFRMGQLGGDTIFTKESSGNVYFRYFDDPSSNPLVVEEEGIYTSRVRFPDGSYFTSSSGVRFDEGTAISFLPVSGSELRKIDLDIDKLSTNDDMSQETYLVVNSSGENYKSSVLNLARFVNPDNPEMFFNCGGGYNVLISRNSDVSNGSNCNNFIGGWKAADKISGFTNSLILGTKAGQNATMQNPDLSIDTAAVFLGYNAGRNSTNADNSVFIGPSAGQDSIYCDNSIFIGNSAGQSSSSSKSIAIGDNTLENVDGENNLEIVADDRINNRLINGEVSNKFNIAGVIAGDSCSSRVSVGGSARIYPHAVLEVGSKFGDHETRLQEWYNGAGELVAYLDQNGNLITKGSVIENNSYFGENNLCPSDNMVPEIECGNNNSLSCPVPNSGNNSGTIGDGDNSYTVTPNNLILSPGQSSTVTLSRSGPIVNEAQIFTVSSNNTKVIIAEPNISFSVGNTSKTFSVYGNSTGESVITTAFGNVNVSVIESVELPTFSNVELQEQNMALGSTEVLTFGTNSVENVANIKWYFRPTNGNVYSLYADRIVNPVSTVGGISVTNSITFNQTGNYYADIFVSNSVGQTVATRTDTGRVYQE